MSAGPKTNDAEAKEERKLSLNVEITDAGPCRKHIRVRVPREDIEHIQSEAVEELSDSVSVPGFRVGHVPAKLVERRFRKEISDQVKQRLLVDSLQQLSEDNELDPINEPNLDVESIDIPEEGDFEYEFDVEVRPQFDLPDYAGITIKRPVREVSEEDVDAYVERFLSQYGQLVPQEDPAETGDVLTLSASFHHGDRVLRRLTEIPVRIRPVLRFQDGELDGFDKLMAGVRPGDIREADMTISHESPQIEMRGEVVHAQFEVLDVKRNRKPEMTKEFFERVGFDSDEEFRVEVRQMLERQVLFQQRQAARSQVLEKITQSADWELPEDLVSKQVENALRREILEMQQAGYTTEQIRARENQIRQQSITTTRQALKEHFVLDKIATNEDLTVTPADIDHEIHLMAMQRGESPRRMRARLVKSGVIENLEAQIRERKAIDIILAKAVYEDSELERPDEDRIEAVSYSISGPATAASSLAEEEDEDGNE